MGKSFSELFLNFKAVFLWKLKKLNFRKILLLFPHGNFMSEPV